MAEMLLLVKISPRMSRKVAIPEVPESVEELQNILKEKLELQGSFRLQYEDSDFNNALCNLIDIHDLPPERAILHILWDETSPLVQQESDSVGSESSLDTASLFSRESLQSPSAFIRNHLRSVSEWPSLFSTPSFSYDVELKLHKGNEAYEQTKKGITLTDMRIDILDKIAQAVFEVKVYPDQDQIESVVSALISRHPCLREPGSETGYDGWKTSIKYKLGNYRSNLHQAGCTEVSINQKKRGSEDDGTSPSLKRAKRGEINHVPDHPENYNDDSLEDERLVLVEEFKKKNKNVALIRQKMEVSFSLRCREIVELQPIVSEVLERWPALFCEAELLFQTSDITAHRQTAALKGLPLYLRDSQEKLFRNCLKWSR
ncbi:sterile alpha motif domain-containing protein 3-like [Chaetodon trifascialis]|uniref:sterile alpha motif domain-containing protein 3-like n=1 Tax=Chaetodon trifascialis TaxID=109706 RepID=UPI003996C436